MNALRKITDPITSAVLFVALLVVVLAIAAWISAGERKDRES